MDYKDVLKSDYFNETYAKIEELKKDFYVNHGFVHVDGVINNAKYLADVFNLDSNQRRLLLIASALHDIGYLLGREGHAKNGSALAGEYLKGKLDDADVGVVARAIASHGGKLDEDYLCPVSMCLILADKLDFCKNRYTDDGKEHSSLPMFLSIEKILLTKQDDSNLVLEIYTTNKGLFEDLENNYFFQKLFEVFRKLERVWGYKTELRVLDWECGV